MVPRPDDWAEETRANQRNIEAMPIVVISHRRIAFVFLRATAVSFLGGRRCFQFLPLRWDAPRCALYGTRWPPFGYPVPLMRVMRLFFFAALSVVLSPAPRRSTPVNGSRSFTTCGVREHGLRARVFGG